MGFLQASLVWVPGDVFDDLFENKGLHNSLFGFLCLQKHKNAFACYHCGALRRPLLLITLTKPPDILCSPCCDVCLLVVQYSMPVTYRRTRREHKHMVVLNIN